MGSLVQAQSWQKSRITVSGGWMRQLFGYDYERQTAPVVGISYGYSPLKFMESEAGVHVALQPGQELCYRFGCYVPDDRYFWVPFGVRFIAPLLAKRLELSLGGGGLYQKYSVSNPDNWFRDGWGGYLSGGTAVALDRRRRFWAGVTPRVILANPKYVRNLWFTITGDLSFHF
ncbi:MAG: hypothetical protein NTW28_24405 [Candidatus Solibacter sp.]|nr:hypothetical protein [Candidatus Solibacter sp.]